jgi:hypothetical protein
MHVLLILSDLAVTELDRTTRQRSSIARADRLGNSGLYANARLRPDPFNLDHQSL